MFIVPSIVAVLLSVSPQVPKPQVPVGGEPDETRPLQWLLHAQNPEGGWGSEVNSPADVATTSLSGIALLRLGSTPASGDHREAAKKGLLFVIRAVERSPRPDQFIEPEGTLPQRKLGRGIDTFLAAQFIGEAVKTMPDGEDRRRSENALRLCVAKIQGDELSRWVINTGFRSF